MSAHGLPSATVENDKGQVETNVCDGCSLLHTHLLFPPTKLIPPQDQRAKTYVKLGVPNYNRVCVCVFVWVCVTPVTSNPLLPQTSPPDVSACGVLQARILGGIAIPFSNYNHTPPKNTYFICLK